MAKSSMTRDAIAALVTKEAETFPKKRRRSFAERSKLSVWVSGAVHRRLLELCIEYGTTQQEILTAGIELWLNERGEPGIAAIDAKAEKGKVS